jgi:hypothetical protein
VIDAFLKELGRGDKCGYRSVTLTNVVCLAAAAAAAVFAAMQVALVLLTRSRRSWPRRQVWL